MNTMGNKPRRRGSLLIELGVSTALLAMMMTVSAQMTLTLRRQADRAAQQAAAMLKLENALEQLAAQPWDEIAAEGELAKTLPESFERGEFNVDVQESSDPIPGKRVTVTLSLGKRTLRLTTWVHRNDPPPQPISRRDAETQSVEILRASAPLRENLELRAKQ